MNFCLNYLLTRLNVVALLSQDELEQIPLPYRLVVKMLLKLPNPSLPFFILKRFPEFEGILWAAGVPILLFLYFLLNFFLVAYLSLHVVFPLSVIITLIIPIVIFLFFLRIQLERTILWWRNIHEPPKEWQTSKTMEELVELFRRQQKRKRS